VSEAEDRNKVVVHWLDRADESLASARDELAADRPLIAMNRLYYAAFYAASAALLAENQRFVKHSGVRAAVNLHFVQTGRIPPEMGQFYNELFDERQDVDYEPFANVSAEDVRTRMAQCEEFLRRARSLIRSG
jgi:uncharacterized protein (UPF0332 family)